MTLKTLKRLPPPPPQLKIVIPLKISPLTYPEKSWLFLPRKEAFWKLKIVKMFYLTAWGLPENQKRPKTLKSDQIVLRLFPLKKSSNQKMWGEKSIYLYIIAKDVNTGRKL